MHIFSNEEILNTLARLSDGEAYGNFSLVPFQNSRMILVYDDGKTFFAEGLLAWNTKYRKQELRMRIGQHFMAFNY